MNNLWRFFGLKRILNNKSILPQGSCPKKIFFKDFSETWNPTFCTRTPFASRSFGPIMIALCLSKLKQELAKSGKSFWATWKFLLRTNDKHSGNCNQEPALIYSQTEAVYSTRSLVPPNGYLGEKIRSCINFRKLLTVDAVQVHVFDMPAEGGLPHSKVEVG